MKDNFTFAHLDWASQVRSQPIKGRKGQPARWSAADILREAARCPGHCAHVARPLPPTVLYGVPLLEVESMALDWANSISNIQGRRWRRDSPILACGVISLPRSRMADWSTFRDEAVAFLVKEYGSRLRSVVEHLDEAHPHLHFYLVPLPGESFGAVHPGYASSRSARKEEKGDARAAYQRAMRQWLDDVHVALGEPFGLQRYGPRRARLTRCEWKLKEMEDAAAKEEQRITAHLAAMEQEVSNKRSLLHKLQEDMQLWQQRRQHAEQQAHAILQQAEEEARDRLKQARKREEKIRAEQARISEALALLEGGSLAELKILNERDHWRQQCETWKSQAKELQLCLELQNEEQARSVALLEQHGQWRRQAMALLNDVAPTIKGLDDGALRERCLQLVRKGALLGNI